MPKHKHPKQTSGDLILSDLIYMRRRLDFIRRSIPELGLFLLITNQGLDLILLYFVFL